MKILLDNMENFIEITEMQLPKIPNFLLFHPSKEFPKATKMNGIHQLALREFLQKILKLDAQH